MVSYAMYSWKLDRGMESFPSLPGPPAQSVLQQVLFISLPPEDAEPSAAWEGHEQQGIVQSLAF